VKINSNFKTAITPNNDGINDKLDIPIIDWQQYPLSRIEIFNRWSQQVYVSEPYQKDWAGQTNDGKELPEGDYFFILSLKPNGDVLKGMVHVFR
jgi:gliding motility-associated-like protein